MKLFLRLALFTFILCLGSVQASAIYSNQELYLNRQHDQEFQNKLHQYFLDSNGGLDTRKLKSTLAYFSDDRKKLYTSALLSEKVKYIEKFNYSDEEASIKALDRIEDNKTFLFCYDQVIEGSKQLLENYSDMTDMQIREEAARLLMFIIPIKTLHKSNIWTDTINLVKHAASPLYGFKLNENKPLEASNLLTMNASDLSKVNPPSSAFWTNNNIEKYDPLNETFYGKKIFPKDSPEVIFHYKRMGRGSPKMSADVEIDGELEGVKIRVGREVHSQILSSHLARSVGYPAIPVVYRKSVKLNLGKKSYSQFLAEWNFAHGLDGFSNPFGRIEKIPNENAVKLTNVLLEAFPSKKYYKKIGPFRSARNGFNNRREYRAQVLYAALINWSDAKTRNIRVDAYRLKKSHPWKTQYYINDTGISMGSWYATMNPNVVNSYPDKMTTKIGNKVYLNYIQKDQHPKTWESATSADLKWLLRRYMRLSQTQLKQMTVAAGLPFELQALYVERIKRRLNDLTISLNMHKELKLFSTTPYSVISEQFPDRVTVNGNLKADYDTTHSNGFFYNGVRADLLESILLGAGNFFTKKVSEAGSLDLASLTDTPIIKTGLFDIGFGVTFGCLREVKVNNLYGVGENRFLINDKCHFSIPLGFNFSEEELSNKSKVILPIATHFNWTLEYQHSEATMLKAFRKKPLRLFVPNKPLKLIQNLKDGESVKISKSYGFSLGHLGVELTKNIKAHIKALNYSQARVNSIYITKSQGTLAEVLISKDSSQKFENAIDIATYIRLLFSHGVQKDQSYEMLYRFNRNKNSDEEIDNAITELYQKKTSPLAEQIATNVESVTLRDSSHMDNSFFIWDWNRSKSTEVQKIDSDIKTQDFQTAQSDYIIRSHYLKRKARSLDQLWNEKIDGGALESLYNSIFKFNKEALTNDALIEAVVKKDFTGFKNLNVLINIFREDNLTSRKEFNKDFLKFFRLRAGEKKYFNFQMPSQIKYYSPLRGRMKWQISQKGVNELLNKLLSQNLEKLGYQNSRQLKSYARGLVKMLKTKSRRRSNKENLKKYTHNLMKLLRRLTNNFQRVEKLRKFISNENLWIITRIENALEYNISAAVEKDIYLMAPEVGRYQGPLYETQRSFNFVDGVLIKRH